MTDADIENMSAFSCGVDELDFFFQHEIKECIERHYLAAYCVYTPENEIIAAFTLMNDALMIEGEFERQEFFEDLKYEAETAILNFYKRQSSYPAINIGHLGVSSRHQCGGIGTAIICFVTTTFSHYTQAGCQFITVDALNNPRTIKFYYRNGFSFQTSRDHCFKTRRMYRIL